MNSQEDYRLKSAKIFAVQSCFATTQPTFVYPFGVDYIYNTTEKKGYIYKLTYDGKKKAVKVFDAKTEKTETIEGGKKGAEKAIKLTKGATGKKRKDKGVSDVQGASDEKTD